MEVSGQYHAPAALLTRERDPRHPLDSSLDEPPRRFWRGGVEKKILAPAGNWTPVVQPVAQSP